jgi:hypothetical protein
MQLHGKRKKDSPFASTGFTDIPLPYQVRLSFYPCPPTEEVSLEEFETFAVDRLKGMHNG